MHPYPWTAVIFVGFSAWFSYDGWFNPGMEWVLFNRAGAIALGILAVGTVARALSVSTGSPVGPAAAPDSFAETPSAEPPASALRWNWGAFVMTPIWGLANRVYPALLSLVPFVGLPVSVWAGLRGGRSSWKHNPWRDEEHYRQVQATWTRLALVFLCAFVVGIPVVAWVLHSLR